MDNKTRREFLKMAAFGAAGSSFFTNTASFSTTFAEKQEAIRKEKSDRIKFTLGMASYTFRHFNLDDTIAMTQRLGLKTIAFKDFHLPLNSTVEQIKAVAAKVKEVGLDLYGCGVVYMKNEDEVNRAFNYARAAGMRTIIGVPEHDLLELVNKKVQEFDIKVAIHNHGPGDERYPSPESAYKRIKNLDKRIGLCIDIGHTQRLGLDPSESAEKFADRLLDVHIKDVSAANKEGDTIEIGRGVIDIPRFLKTLIKINYSGMASFEFEKDKEDPLPGVAESVGYVKGVLAVI
jgi:inosose dehydratase